ncbi:MAG: hypothetical protein HRT40_13015, partial [Campylobacteraceae bacterium]|nr:hypothetical protein [Campylobacteraceae bacterium]
MLSASEDTINVNFKNLEIKDLIKITSKIINKNILITTPIKGKVDFISNKPVKKDEIINILMYVLQGKGYTIVENNEILRIVRINDTSKYNAPVVNNLSKKYYQMITKVFKVSYSNVDYVASKIRHLISKSAKLVTDKESNSIVITDFVENIRTIQKVVNLITKNNKKHIIVMELKNINATQAASNLKLVAKSVFNEKVLKEKVSIIANKDNNSIMIVGKKSNVLFLKARLESSDKNDSLIKRVVEVIPLKNVEAKNVIKIITAIIGKKKYLDPNLKPLSSVDIETNSIVLSGPSSEIELIKELISKLDKDKLQVYVKTTIIEISKKKINDIGVKYGLSGLKQGSDGLLSLAGSFAESFSLPSIPFADSKGNVTSFNALALGVSINFLNQNGAANIVSEPSVLCVNNIESSIYVGKTISIKTNSSTTSGGLPQSSFKREDIGLKLQVKPRISNDNKVTLQIEAVLEDVEGTTTNDQPNTSKKEIKTTAIVKNGQSVIIGGLIRNKTEYTEDKVPFLGSIPLIGWLFRSQRELEDKINLVVIVTPYIISANQTLDDVRKKLSQLTELETKYAKDLELRLLQNKLKKVDEDKEREEKIKEINEEFLEKTKKIKKTGELSEHQKRINRIFGR